MERWLVRELELSKRHEELVMQREALLRGTETYFDSQEARSSSFIVDYSKAMERNHMLTKDINECINELKHEVCDPGTLKFQTLKNNYWTMVRNVFPVWHEELQDYEKRHGVQKWSPSPRSQRLNPQPSTQEPQQSVHNGQARPRQARTSFDDLDDTTLISDIPALDLDFSITDDGTTKSALTPKAGKSKGSKKVHYDEESLRSTGRSKSAPMESGGKRRSVSLSPARDNTRNK